MDQQHWDSEELDDDFEPESQADSESNPEIFYVALKLALARLKEFSTTPPS